MKALEGLFSACNILWTILSLVALSAFAVSLGSVNSTYSFDHGLLAFVNDLVRIDTTVSCVIGIAFAIYAFVVGIVGLIASCMRSRGCFVLYIVMISLVPLATFAHFLWIIIESSQVNPDKLAIAAADPQNSGTYQFCEHTPNACEFIIPNIVYILSAIAATLMILQIIPFVAALFLLKLYSNHPNSSRKQIDRYAADDHNDHLATSSIYKNY